MDISSVRIFSWTFSKSNFFYGHHPQSEFFHGHFLSHNLFLATPLDSLSLGNRKNAGSGTKAGSYSFTGGSATASQSC